MTSLATDRRREDLTESFAPELARFVLDQVGSGEVASRIVGEAFKRLKAEGAAVAHPRGFLFRVAHELAIDHLRAEGRYNHDLQDIARFAMEVSRDRGGATPPGPARSSNLTPTPKPASRPPSAPDPVTSESARGQAEKASNEDRIARLEGALLTLPTRRMQILFDRRLHGRSLESIAKRLGDERPGAAREVALAASSVYLELHPDFPASSQERERLLTAFG